MRLDPALITGSIGLLKQFAASGTGVTLLPAFCAAQEIADGVLVALPLADPGLDGVEARIVTRLGRQLPPAAGTLLQHLARGMAGEAKGGARNPSSRGDARPAQQEKIAG